MNTLNGKQKAYDLLQSRGPTGITSVELAMMFNGRTLTARINDLVDEHKAVATPLTIAGIRRKWYRSSIYLHSGQSTDSSLNTLTKESKKSVNKPLYRFDEERQVYVQI